MHGESLRRSLPHTALRYQLKKIYACTGSAIMPMAMAITTWHWLHYVARFDDDGITVEWGHQTKCLSFYLHRAGQPAHGDGYESGGPQSIHGRALMESSLFYRESEREKDRGTVHVLYFDVSFSLAFLPPPSFFFWWWWG